MSDAPHLPPAQLTHGLAAGLSGLRVPREATRRNLLTLRSPAEPRSFVAAANPGGYIGADEPVDA